MTLAASIPKQVYDGNGVAENFSFLHKIWADGDLVIQHKTSADVVTTLALNTDYTVNATYPTDGLGTAVVTVDFPKAGSSYSTLDAGPPVEQLMIKRDLVKQQTPDMSGSFQFKTLNAGNDKQTAMVQEILVKVNRAALQSEFTTTDPPTLEAVLATTGLGNLNDLTAKAVLIAADLVHIGDSPDSFSDKKATLTSLMTFIIAQLDAGKYAAALEGNIILELDGQGLAIATGEKGWIRMAYAGTITGYELTADQSGSIVIDVWVDTYANFPPTVADTITAAAPPTLSGAIKAVDTTLTGWTVAFNAGDYVKFNVVSATTVEKVLLSIQTDKTGA